MLKYIDIRDEFAAEQILRLQRVAYQTEAELLNYYRIPPLTEHLSQLMSSKETFIAFEKQNEIVGVLSYEIENFNLNICRLAINPENFRQGIATRLIGHLAQVRLVKNYTVTTGLDNAPALEFYKKEGFIKTGESYTDGVRLIHLIKENAVTNVAQPPTNVMWHYLTSN